MTLEKKSYPRKVEFDFDDKGNNVANFIEIDNQVIEDGVVISDKTHRAVVSFELASQVLLTKNIEGIK